MFLEWIPVEDGLPNEGQEVIVAFDHVRCGPCVDRAVFQHVVCGDEYIESWTTTDFLLTGITHWMPMPKHPRVLADEHETRLMEHLEYEPWDEIYEEETY